MSSIGMCRNAAPVSTRDELPGDEVRVMLELGDHDRVPGTEVLEPPRVGDQVDRLGGAAGEDDLPLGRCVEEGRDGPPSALVPLGRQLGQPVDATMNIGVLVLVERPHPIENLPWLLRRRRRVEIRERPAAGQLLEEREIGAEDGGVERTCGIHGHRAMVAGRLIAPERGEG